MGRKRGVRRARGGLLAACALVLISGSAGAQTSTDDVGVGISPARIQRDLPGRSISEQVRIVNNEPDPRRIKLSVAGLGHDLDGAPSFFEQGAARESLSLSATEFTLAPSESKTVAVTGAIPSNERSLYASVVAEFSRLTPQAGQIEVRERVASFLLYRAPKPWRQTVEIVDVQLVPEPDGKARVAAAIKATGDVHVNPTGEAKISKDGTELATVKLTGQFIIPEFARRLSGKWIPPAKLTGKVTVVVRTQDPPAEFTKTIDLGVGVADRPQAEIANLRGSSEEGGRVGLLIRNTGRVPITPAVTLFVRQGGIERARTILPQPELKPGASQEVTWKPSLGDGVYLVTAQLRTGQDLLDEATTDLRIGAAAQAGAGTADRTPIIVLASLLLLLALAGLVLMLRRRKPDDDGDGSGPSPVRETPPARQPVGAGSAR